MQRSNFRQKRTLVAVSDRCLEYRGSLVYQIKTRFERHSIITAVNIIGLAAY
jgi:hypothetical protein